MKLIIDPAWSLERTIEAAFEAYTGIGITSRGYRMSVLMVWANIVGRKRAVSELLALRSRLGGWRLLATEVGVGEATLRRVRQHFEAVPEHVISPLLLPQGSNDITALFGLERLGSGGNGEVWRAIDALGRKVAVKYMTGATMETQEAVLEHARPLAFLGSHPNIVAIYNCIYLKHPSLDTLAPALVMEYIHGETLRERLKKKIDLQTVISICESLCNAITFIHSKGLTHGDLHEDNIMISSSGEVKVIDLVNHRRLSKITPGFLRNGENDDVESLKAILSEAIKAAGQLEAQQNFIKGAQAVRHSVAVRGELLKLRTSSSQRLESSENHLSTFLSTWQRVESKLLSLAGQSADKKIISIAILAKQISLSPEIQKELHEIKSLRDKAVHGEPESINAQVLERAIKMETALQLLQR